MIGLLLQHYNLLMMWSISGCKDMDGDGQSGKRNSRNLVGVLLVVFICLLFIGVLSDELAESISLRNLRQLVAVETGRRYASVNPDPIYASKRRVPTGPDPFHNRHVGETRRQPGRV